MQSQFSQRREKFVKQIRKARRDKFFSQTRSKLLKESSNLLQTEMLSPFSEDNSREFADIIDLLNSILELHSRDSRIPKIFLTATNLPAEHADRYSRLSASLHVLPGMIVKMNRHLAVKMVRREWQNELGQDQLGAIQGRMNQLLTLCAFFDLMLQEYLGTEIELTNAGMISDVTACLVELSCLRLKADCLGVLEGSATWRVSACGNELRVWLYDRIMKKLIDTMCLKCVPVTIFVNCVYACGNVLVTLNEAPGEDCSGIKSMHQIIIGRILSYLCQSHLLGEGAQGMKEITVHTELIVWLLRNQLLSWLDCPGPSPRICTPDYHNWLAIIEQVLDICTRMSVIESVTKQLQPVVLLLTNEYDLAHADASIRALYFSLLRSLKEAMTGPREESGMIAIYLALLEQKIQPEGLESVVTQICSRKIVCSNGYVLCTRLMQSGAKAIKSFIYSNCAQNFAEIMVDCENGGTEYAVSVMTLFGWLAGFEECLQYSHLRESKMESKMEIEMEIEMEEQLLNQKRMEDLLRVMAGVVESGKEECASECLRALIMIADCDRYVTLMSNALQSSPDHYEMISALASSRSECTNALVTALFELLELQ